MIISFAGHGLQSMGVIPQFEFLKTLTMWYPNYNIKFLTDPQKRWYHKGIPGLSTNIPETVSYLETLVSGYKKVVFMGTSAGGYAALLFGSLLNVSTVIAFKPQTLLTEGNLDNSYCDLKGLLNNTTVYHVYGDMSVTEKSDNHHHHHVKNIEGPLNVHAVYRRGLDLRSMRDSGELQSIITSHIPPSTEVKNPSSS